MVDDPTELVLKCELNTHLERIWVRFMVLLRAPGRGVIQPLPSLKCRHLWHRISLPGASQRAAGGSWGALSTQPAPQRGHEQGRLSLTQGPSVGCRNSYSLYCAELMANMKDVPSTERMVLCSQQWKLLSQKEKDAYHKKCDQVRGRGWTDGWTGGWAPVCCGGEDWDGRAWAANPAGSEPLALPQCLCLSS